MATKKTGSKTSTPKLGMVGCGTAEVMFKSQVKKHFESIDGVVGIEVKETKIILRIRDEEVAKKLPKTYRRRKIETIVTGVISKREVK
ncbi:MAG: hypothetical protein IAF58_01535 [Leptolyngbya sp.]|nr:hypothetical protein [Candidatus Melainabacteria bacterium]